MKTPLMVLSLLVLGSSCATIIQGRYQAVPVTSSPAGANIAVDCNGEQRDAGLTPAVVTVPRAAEVCRLTLTRSGYEPAQVWFERARSNVRFVNLAPSAYFAVAGAILGFALVADHAETPGAVIAATAAGGYAGARAPFAIDERTGAAYKQTPEEVKVTLVPRP